MFFGRKKEERAEPQAMERYDPNLKFQHVVKISPEKALIIHVFITDKYYRKEIDENLFPDTPQGRILSRTWVTAVINNMKCCRNEKIKKEGILFAGMLKNNSLTVLPIVYKTSRFDGFGFDEDLGKDGLIREVKIVQLGEVTLTDEHQDRLMKNTPSRYYPHREIISY